MGHLDDYAGQVPSGLRLSKHNVYRILPFGLCLQYKRIAKAHLFDFLWFDPVFSDMVNPIFGP